MKILIIFCFAITFSSCEKSTREKNEERAKEVKELKQDIQATEWQEPLKYLSAQLHWTLKLLGDDQINITFRNSATLASFHQIEYEINFLNQNGYVISSLPRISKGPVRPNSTLTQEELFKFPRGTQKLTIKIKSALPAPN